MGRSKIPKEKKDEAACKIKREKEGTKQDCEKEEGRDNW